MLQHHVFIKFAAGTTDAHIEELSRRVRGLVGVVPGIEDLVIGRDILHEARSWDMMLSMRFASVEVLRQYQKHPAHMEVMAFNQSAVADVGSIDFLL